MIIYTSDWHLSSSQPENRLDNVLDAGLYKVEYVLKRAKELGATVVVGGDIFDIPCPPYSLVNSLMQLLLKYKVPVYSIVGNHDVEGANITLEDTAIFTLFKSGLIKKLTYLLDKDSNLEITGVDYTKDIPSSVNAVSNFDTTKKVLVIHNALMDVPKENEDKIPFKCISLENFKTNANLVLCGHIHLFFCKKVGNTSFISPGCLVRRKVNERVLDPTLCIIDKKLSVEKIPLIKKAEFNIQAKESKSVLRGLITDTKIESSDIEESILKSGYSDSVKEFCISEIKKVRGKE